MNVSLPFQFLADAVLLIHFAIVIFVVGGLVLIVAGNLLSWRCLQWVNHPWFRIAHLAAIAIVVAESLLEITCPLTTLESWLRIQAGLAPYDASFIQHWVQRMIFYEAPAWVFTVAYTIFATLVILTWWIFPPRFGKPGPKA